MRTEVEAFEEAQRYFHEEVAPLAQEIDASPEKLREVVDGLFARDLMALKRPAAFGGPEMSEPLFRRYQEEVARTSGSLAFLTTQHQSAVAMIARGENRELAEEYLPGMGNGAKRVGIGFSQLRRTGPPLMRATETDGGYVLDGHVPWVTGWRFYSEFLVGAALPDGRSVFGVVPLEDLPDGTLTVGPTMVLAAMNAANTVTVDFHHYFLPAAKVAFVRPPQWIHNSDQINIALQGHFALGCAEAGIDIVRAAAAKKPFPFLQETVAALEKELAQCRYATGVAQQSTDEETTEERLRVRAWAIDLAVRAAHAGIAASSGAANSVNHPAQRVYREALVFTVSAQTVPVMEATLKRLIRA